MAVDSVTIADKDEFRFLLSPGDNVNQFFGTKEEFAFFFHPDRLCLYREDQEPLLSPEKISQPFRMRNASCT